MKPGAPSLRRADWAWLAASLVPLAYTLFDTSDGDIPLYHAYAGNLARGLVPYRDWVFEYPPWAILWLAVPGVASGYTAFRMLFSLQVLAFDIAAKVALLREGPRLTEGTGLDRRAPFLLFAILVAFQSYFYLKRLDAIAAALTLLSLLGFARGRHALSGAVLAVATGTKLYPGLLAPALLVLAIRKRKGWRFVLGGLAGVLPILAISGDVPWWRFASFHTARGLQVESTYASVIWLAHFFGLAASWASRPGCLEVDGPMARSVLPIARLVFALVTLGAVAQSVVVAARSPAGAATQPLESKPAERYALLGWTALVVISAFMASSIVLSPQFAAWLIGPLALAAAGAGTRRGPLLAVAAAIVLTAFVFPAPGYFSPQGISLAHTVVLVARNAVLVSAFSWLVLTPPK